MHTSALLADDDLFTPEAAPPPGTPHTTGPQLQFEGVLVHHAQVRNRPARDGLHTVPVVCMELKSTLPGTARYCYASQPFTDATRHEAEQLARQLKKGSHVTVTAPAGDMRITFPHATTIQLIQEPTAS